MFLVLKTSQVITCYLPLLYRYVTLIITNNKLPLLLIKVR